MKRICTLLLIATLAITTAVAKPTKKEIDSLQLRNTTIDYKKGGINIAVNYPQMQYPSVAPQNIKTLATNLNADVCRSIARTASTFQQDTILSQRALSITTGEALKTYLFDSAAELIAEYQTIMPNPSYEVFSQWSAFGNNYIVSMFQSIYCYVGGAHGLTIGVYNNYWVETGERFDIRQSISDTADLLELASIYFCKERRLPYSAIKLQTGLFFELADLPMPNQLGFSVKGLVLYYYPYSIAPYSFGPVSITIPYRVLDDVLGDDFCKAYSAAGGGRTYNERVEKSSGRTKRNL